MTKKCVCKGEEKCDDVLMQTSSNGKSVCQVMRGSGALFVRQPGCREMKFEKLQTDGKERRKKTPQTVPQPPFYTRGEVPSLRELPTIEENQRGTALTPSLRLSISDPARGA